MGIQECNHRGAYLGHPFCKFNSKNEAYTTTVEKLANKLTRWKQKALSMAGRMVLIKSMVQSLPIFIMQSFMLPKGTLIKMDTLIRGFFWGVKDSQAHKLYLKSWSSICMSKSKGGLGIRSMVDINQIMLSKLAWNLCVESKKPWIKLIKAKYRRGNFFLEVDISYTANSWLWGGIMKCNTIITRGACFQVGSQSLLKIQNTPWIGGLPSFKLPPELNLPPSYDRIKDLMVKGTTWNKGLVRSLFPPHIVEHILSTLILDSEHERLIWTPSSTKSFSVKSTYTMVIQDRSNYLCSSRRGFGN